MTNRAQKKIKQNLSLLNDVHGPLKTYVNRFVLDKLIPGVDNIRYDAHIGPEFIKSTKAVVYWLLASQARALGVDPITSKKSSLESTLSEFKIGFSNIMRSAINQAKLRRQSQIIFLAQTAVVKIVLKEVTTQFDGLIDRYKQLIRKHEISHTHDLGAVFRIKEDMAKVQQSRLIVTMSTYRELWKAASDVWRNDLRQGCIANFGNEASLPEEFFNNPVLFVDGVINDYFMIDEYVLLGHRFDDPLRYDAMLSMLKNFIAGSTIIETNTELDSVDPDKAAVPPSKRTNRKIDAETDEAEGAEYGRIIKLLCRIDNIDTLFNHKHTAEQLKQAKKEKADRDERERLKIITTLQKRLSQNFYNECRKAGLLNVVAAAYAMQPLLATYCPALLPHEVLTFLIDPGERKKIADKLKRLKSLSGKKLNVKALNKMAAKVKGLKKKKKKDYLLRFLKEFAKYHRDFENFQMLKEGLQWVNILEDDKTINLSRVNRTLYEFLDDADRVLENRPIRNHVILKTDLRGSTEITSGLNKKGLNPASYFSLNFFDPINAILPEYGASKVFIEGDAFILSIFEEEDAPEGWYSVARASGLALKILQIVQRYNLKNRKNSLPALEQGIGICYRDEAPAFLFDGDNRIMISSAINRADRLSSCAKPLRKLLADKKDVFNLYVFVAKASASDDPADIQYLRYNVNGIELDSGAFEKLGQEIDLKTIDLPLPEMNNKRIRIHTGIFPTQSGRYKRLIIRESRIPEIDPKTFRAKRLTPETYYEVCTHTGLYDRVKKQLNSSI